MRSLVAVPGAPKLIAAALGLMITLPIVSLAPPAAADPAPTTTLTVTVVDANGDDIDGATVQVAGGGSPSAMTVGGDASFELTSGSYQLSSSADGFVTDSYRDDEDAIATIVVDADADTVSVGGEEVEGGDLSQTLQSNPKSVSGIALGADNAGLAGITVQAAPEDGPAVTAQSGAGGTFTLQLPIGSYTVTYLGAVVGNYTYVSTPYAGGKVLVSQTATPTLTAQKLAINDGSTRFDLKGTTSDWDGNALTDVQVSVVAAGGNTVAGSQATKLAGGDAVFKIGVLPGKYQLRFEKAGYATTYLENGVDDGPVTVTVSATGTITAPDVDLNTDGSLPDVTLLLPAATMVKAPTVTGKAVAGQTLVVTTGAWAGIDVDTDYVTVDWFIDGKPADDYSYGAWLQKFDVPVEAVGKRVGFKLTVDDPEGAHVSSVYEGSTGVVPKAAAKLKGTFKKGKLGVALTVAGLPKPTGNIVVKEGKKTLATIKLKAKSKGKGVATLSKLKAGKHKLTLVYAGSKSVNAAKATVKVKI